MKNHFTARFTAAVLAAGIYCLYSPHPCVLHAGEAQERTRVAWAADTGAAVAAADPGIFSIDPDTERTKYIRSAARACVEALGDPGAAIDDGTGTCVDTGFTGDYETAREVYSASNDFYYGNTGYSMEYERYPGGDVRLFLRTCYGTPGQAYREHLEAERALKDIAASFSGTDAEKAEQIFQWVCSHVAYADDETVSRLDGIEPGCVPDYTGINATTYTAVMDGAATCTGFSGMLLALFDMAGVPSARVQNSLHAYNAAYVDGRWVLYDAASSVSGDPGSFLKRYGKYYEPKTLTCGFMAAPVHIGDAAGRSQNCPPCSIISLKIFGRR